MNYDIVKTMKAIVNYYDETRGRGHTSVVLQGTDMQDIMCFTTKKHGRRVVSKYRRAPIVTSLRSLDSNLRGMDGPLVFDNSAIRELCAMALKRIERKERKPGGCKDCYARKYFRNN